MMERLFAVGEQREIFLMMTGCGFWKDDAQVVSEIAEKFWVREKPGIYGEVHSLDSCV